MRRVLLVLEDYNELLFLETLLKKVGFVVESIRNELSLNEKLMSFSPELVIATGEGNKINGIRVSKKVKKKGSHTKLLLLFPRHTLQTERSLDNFIADGAVETPLNPRSIITSVCQLSGVAPEGIMAKFEKLPIAQEQEASPGIQIISSKKMPPKADVNSDASKSGEWVPEDPEKSRAARYARILKNAPKEPEAAFSRQRVLDEMERVKKLPDPPNAEDVENQRLAFAKALFKKQTKK
jgi:DNA-binding response OmpR family regulator